jgi:type VII secretion integral membrane protein EccD
MSTTPATVRGTETSRLTVVGPAGQADLAVPGMVTIGELLPLIARHVTGAAESDQSWVLQRLGESPFDPDHTAEMIGLRDGEVLYLRPAEHAMPAIEFDDVSVGVASVVSGRPDHWRPDFTRRLLLALAWLLLAAYLAGALVLRSQVPPAVYLGAAAALLVGGGVLIARRVGDAGMFLLTGLSGCAFAAIAALVVQHQHGGDYLSLSAGRLQIAALCAAAAAAAALAARRPPADPYVGVIALSVACLAGASLARGAHWDGARAAAVLAIVVFMFGARMVRIVLRSARLRAPNPPTNAAELLLDIEPEPGARVAQRTASAVAYLNGLIACVAVVVVVATVLLAQNGGWAGWALAAALSGAILMRSRAVVGVWQRVPLAVGGTVGLTITILSIAAHTGPEIRLAMLLVLLAAAALLVVGARRLPAARLLPVWGHVADLAETWTAIALVPLLLQVLHVYSTVHSLVH